MGQRSSLLLNDLALKVKFYPQITPWQQLFLLFCCVPFGLSISHLTEVWHKVLWGSCSLCLGYGDHKDVYLHPEHAAVSAFIKAARAAGWWGKKKKKEIKSIYWM